MLVTAKQQLDRAWRFAGDVGSYQCRADVVQTTHPTPRLENAGRQTKSTRLTVELINGADHIFAMTQGHVNAVRELVPSAGPRVRPLIPGEDIDDPIGGTDQVYKRCLGQIEGALKTRLDEVEI